ncbi:uncharacterized protein METZ01_LOCUS223882, partial [marine metagenome]
FAVVFQLLEILLVAVSNRRIETTKK